MWGDPNLPKIREDDGAERRLWLTQGGMGGTVDEKLNGFNAAVNDLPEESHVQKRV